MASMCRRRRPEHSAELAGTIAEPFPKPGKGLGVSVIPGSNNNYFRYREYQAIPLYCGYNQFVVAATVILQEDEILSRLSVGDPAALETLIRSNYPVLCRFAEKFLPDASLAKDVVQESFIKLWKSGRSFDSIQ